MYSVIEAWPWLGLAISKVILFYRILKIRSHFLTAENRKLISREIGNLRWKRYECVAGVSESRVGSRGEGGCMGPGAGGAQEVSSLQGCRKWGGRGAAAPPAL